MAAKKNVKKQIPKKDTSVYRDSPPRWKLLKAEEQLRERNEPITIAAVLQEARTITERDHPPREGPSEKVMEVFERALKGEFKSTRSVREALGIEKGGRATYETMSAIFKALLWRANRDAK